jgi:flagellar capping protein FliD|tara:strand:- start:276 stop:524 length:249 start_codon:yes stop_codon:yes gene_type:complete
MWTPELIAAVISGSVGAFAGITRALNNFNKKLDRRFETLDREIDDLKNHVVRNYVLKEDFLREMQAVHNKLDRILDHLLAQH